MYNHSPNSITKCRRAVFSLAISFLFSPTLSADEHDPEQVLEQDFWGKQYENGGTTFYCKESFKSKSPLVSESYIYSEGAIRSALDCGTKRRCLKNSEEYRKITSDLHNIVPANAFFELKRKGTVFGVLDKTESETLCGMRRRMHIIEPPDEVKGDIARVIFYMHEKYGLPIPGSRLELEAWAQQDPVSPSEIQRHEKVKEIQGDTSTIWSPQQTTASTLQKSSVAVN